MLSTQKASKSERSSSTKSAAPRGVPKTKQTPVQQDVDEESVNGDSDHLNNDETDDDEGVDEEGMSKLLKALGNDGLDEYELAQLEVLGGGDGESEDEDEKGMIGEDGEDGEEGWETSEEEENQNDEENSEDEGSDDARSGIGEENNAQVESHQDEEADVALDEVESVDEDAIPRQKIEIDNKIALERIRDTIQLDPSFPWTETLSISYSEKIEVDVDDDLNRELSFYKQALHAATTARSLASKHNFPFTRPTDYFAEMVKSDAHMERIRQRLLNEDAGIKKGEEKRREREGKKFGKQVQIEKLKERDRSKKDMEQRLKGLKRKHKDTLDTQGDADGFDIAVEDAISDRPSKRSKSDGDSRRGLPRSARDQKFGYGGKGKRDKQNTKASTDNFDAGSSRGKSSRGKGTSGRGGRAPSRGGKRPGRGRRIAARGRS